MPPAPSPLPRRVLHCANGKLYLLMALCAVGAAAYATIAGKLSGPLQVSIGTAVALVALFWAAYYATLRYEVSAEGLTRRAFWRSQTRPWSKLLSAELYEHEAQGVATCRIRLTYADKVWCISSELFDPDSVQELKQDLTAAGILSRPADTM